MLNSQYGRFIDDGEAYEILNSCTPRPWTNVISNGRYGFVISQNGGGFSWLDHCQLNVLTRWEMDHLRDDRGRFMYLADLEGDQSVWSLSPHPCRTNYDEFGCIHRAGSTTFNTRYKGIAAAWTLAVATNDQAEVWTVTLTNESANTRQLRLGSFFQWCCGTAPDSKREFHQLFFTTRYDESRHAIFAAKNLWEAPFGTPEDHWNRPWPYIAGFAMSQHPGDQPWATADSALFLGRKGDQSRPRGMTDTCIPSFGRFGDACAALGADLTLKPGESTTRVFVLSIEESQPALESTLDRLTTLEAADSIFSAVTKGWQERMQPTRVRSDSTDFDLMNNHWLPYQAISARLWARTGYYQQSGAFGFRDQLQDSQIWLHREPARCRAQILHHAAHQFVDGSVYHWWNPLTETGLHDQCSDDYLWLPFVLSSYIRETGDLKILEEQVRFVDEVQTASLLDHAKRSIARSLSRQSERGLPLIGDNDWNDGLSAVGTADAGESIWLAFFLCSILSDFGQVLTRAGDTDTSKHYAQALEQLKTAIEEHAWDGAWYRRATNATGQWLGSMNSTEGNIFLNAQTWAILSDAANNTRASKAWESAKAHLFTDYGPLLLSPAYTVPDPTIGYLSRYAPGSRENGGVYMHAATWALAAAAVRRDVAAVDAIWKSISPPLRATDANGYAAEPYVLPGNVDGPLSSTPGRAGWTWYTGSAAWLNRVSIEYIIGARAVWEGLLIDPCPFAELGEVVAVRRWRGRDITIQFDAASFDPNYDCIIELDGVPVPANTITEAMIRPGRSATVTVRWASEMKPIPEILVRTPQRSDS